MAGLQEPSLQGPGSQNEPGGLAALVAQIKALQGRLDELERGAMLRAAGIRVAPEGMTIDSDLTSVTGALDVAGAMRILGTVSLPAGIIDNDALASPVDFGASGTSATGFGLTSTPTDRAASTIAVPAGYTRAIVHVTVDATAVNTVLSGLLMLSANINGTSGGENSGAPGPNSYYANASASAIRTLTGLSGGNITVAATVHCDAGTWPAMAWNIANVNAIAVFLR